jgi:hypothetical protein
MHKFHKLFALVLLTFLLGACSSITQGTDQEVYVDTVSVMGAKCVLNNSKGSWSIASTPGTANVARGGGEMKVRCEKKHYKKSERLVPQSLEPMTFGNVLIGGVIGVMVDAGTGAAFSYPSNVSVALIPDGTKIPEEKDQAPIAPVASLPSIAPKAEQNFKPIQINKYKDFQGNWKGYQPYGCLKANGGWDSDVEVFATVKNDELKLKIISLTNNNLGPRFVKGQDLIPSDSNLVFDGIAINSNKVEVIFDQSLQKIRVSLSSTCNVELKRTGRTTIEANFQGKPSIATQQNYANLRKQKQAGTATAPTSTTFVAAPPKTVNLTNLQGNWRGYGKQGCLDVNGKPADAEIFVRVEGDKFKMLMKNFSSIGGDSQYKGQGIIGLSHEIRFQPGSAPNNVLKFALLNEQKVVKADFGLGCQFDLVQTPRRIIKDGFTGKPAVDVRDYKDEAKLPAWTPLKPVTKNSTAPAVKTTVDFTSLQGNWAGFEATGCMTIGGWDMDADLGINVTGNHLKMYAKHNAAGDRTKVFQAEDIIPENGIMVFEQPIWENPKVTLNVNAKAAQITVKYRSKCIVSMKRTGRSVIPTGFKGVPMSPVALLSNIS